MRPRGATGQTGAKGVSIHAPRVGCDHNPPQDGLSLSAFQFTHPVWGATKMLRRCRLSLMSFNSRTPCGVRQPIRLCRQSSSRVSIHAPRVGCDTIYLQRGARRAVSIHAPRVGCDGYWTGRKKTASEFQFTHPVWGATLQTLLSSPEPPFQFTHPVWGATARSPVCALGRSFNSRTPCGVRP